jgi:hypothetical protein
MSIGAILQTCAFSVQQMIVARIITGSFLDCSHCDFELELYSRAWQWVSFCRFFIYFLFLFISQSHAFISEVSTRLQRQYGKVKLQNLLGEENWLYSK